MREKIKKLLNQLAETQQELTQLLSALADDQDWRPAEGEWSFRFIAAHLATSEAECFLERFMRLRTQEKPIFESYFNDGRDFSHLDLRESLEAWKQTRQAIIESVRGLSDGQLLLTGKHEVFGEMNVQQLLQLMLDHDQEHIRDLRKTIELYKQR